jgi:hypothetical protein
MRSYFHDLFLPVSLNPKGKYLDGTYYKAEGGLWGDFSGSARCPCWNRYNDQELR